MDVSGDRFEFDLDDRFELLQNVQNCAWKPVRVRKRKVRVRKRAGPHDGRKEGSVRRGAEACSTLGSSFEFELSLSNSAHSADRQLCCRLELSKTSFQGPFGRKAPIGNSVTKACRTLPKKSLRSSSGIIGRPLGSSFEFKLKGNFVPNLIACFMNPYTRHSLFWDSDAT